MKYYYEVEKLEKASFFCKCLSIDLKQESLNKDELKHIEADLVSHIERLILVAERLRSEANN